MTVLYTLTSDFSQPISGFLLFFFFSKTVKAKYELRREKNNGLGTEHWALQHQSLDDVKSKANSWENYFNDVTCKWRSLLEIWKITKRRRKIAFIQINNMLSSIAITGWNYGRQEYRSVLPKLGQKDSRRIQVEALLKRIRIRSISLLFNLKRNTRSISSNSKINTLKLLNKMLWKSLIKAFEGILFEKRLQLAILFSTTAT